METVGGERAALAIFTPKRELHGPPLRGEADASQRPHREDEAHQRPRLPRSRRRGCYVRRWEVGRLPLPQREDAALRPVPGGQPLYPGSFGRRDHRRAGNSHRQRASTAQPAAAGGRFPSEHVLMERPEPRWAIGADHGPLLAKGSVRFATTEAAKVTCDRLSSGCGAPLKTPRYQCAQDRSVTCEISRHGWVLEEFTLPLLPRETFMFWTPTVRFNVMLTPGESRRTAYYTASTWPP